MEVQRIPKRTVSVIEPQKSILVDKEKYHQKRVAAYCRVSTDSEEQLTSYPVSYTHLDVYKRQARNGAVWCGNQAD